VLLVDWLHPFFCEELSGVIHGQTIQFIAPGP
jgi:hypothetical protein